MCMGGRPSAPQIVYQGPSKAEIQAQQQQLESFRENAAKQQAAMASQLQTQIDSTNSENARRREMLNAELAKAAADAAAAQNTTYATTVTTAAPENAVTTGTAMKKKKPKESLQIGRSPARAAAGTGLNIGT
jgi:hypothetical protein